MARIVGLVGWAFLAGSVLLTALYLFLVVSAFGSFVTGWTWPCDWLLHEALNPRCPSPDLAD